MSPGSRHFLPLLTRLSSFFTFLHIPGVKAVTARVTRTSLTSVSPSPRARRTETDDLTCEGIWQRTVDVRPREPLNRCVPLTAIIPQPLIPSGYASLSLTFLESRVTTDMAAPTAYTLTQIRPPQPQKTLAPLPLSDYSAG